MESDKLKEKTKGCDSVVEAGSALTDVRHSSLSTVHPNIILRTPIFTPSARNPHPATGLGRTADVSEEMQKLTFARSEGYDKVMISGYRLDIETDFRVWCGITQAFESAGFCSEGVVFDFKEFASLCGYPSKHLTTVLRERIDRSLTRIMSQVISFSRAGKGWVKTHLIHRAEYNLDTDEIRLIPDASLWDLYRIDHNILLYIEHQAPLKGKPVALCLQMYLAALPANPVPISMTRLRERVALKTSKVAEANRSITNALAELKKIGYLDYEIVTKNRERYVLIHERHKQLKSK